MEVQYNRRQAVVEKFDAQTQKLMHDAKELYAAAEAHANATMAQRDLVAAEQEMKRLEREEWDDLRLEHELEALASCEATIAAKRKDLEETRAMVLARELATDNRDSGLNSREEELADREKRLVEREQQLMGRQLQELAMRYAWVS
jgi:uncharacterized protein (DUF3084 family)